MNNPEEPEDPWTNIFTPAQLRVMGFSSIALALVVLGFGLLVPDRLDTPMARFLVCLTVSVFLSIFFFVFYPHRYELDRIPLVNLPIRVVGPVVLWIAVLLLLLELAPQSTAHPVGRLFIIKANIERFHYLPDTLLEPMGKHFKWRLVENRDKPREALGFYVEFEPGDHIYEAWVKHINQQPVKVEFRRDGSEVVPVNFPKGGT
jgi:hypothetical protein